MCVCMDNAELQLNRQIYKYQAATSDRQGNGNWRMYELSLPYAACASVLL